MITAPKMCVNIYKLHDLLDIDKNLSASLAVTEF